MRSDLVHGHVAGPGAAGGRDLAMGSSAPSPEPGSAGGVVAGDAPQVGEVLDGSRRRAPVGPSARKPVVAVAGRPNVGKSTLVNRIVGRRAAVVQERPGVTRDRLELDAQWNGVGFTVVDTGGWTTSDDDLDGKVSAQAERAAAAADLVLLVVDTAVGVTEEDLAVARRLRRIAPRVMVVANKADNERRELDAWAFVQLGLGDPVAVSALHGRGSGDLLDAVIDAAVAAVAAVAPAAPPAPGAPDAPDAPDAPAPARLASHEGSLGSDPERAVDEAGCDDAGQGVDQLAGGPGDGGGARGDVHRGDECPAVALVGRPNVGKSTLFNRIIGEDRSVVHDLPGTTRDAIDTVVDTAAGPIRFVDTAGIRRRSHVEEGTEFYAMVRALQAVDRADIAVLVIDATIGVTHQDQRLAERIGASGSPVVVVLNKWEVVDRDDRPEVVADVEDRLAFLGDVPVLKVSALTGLGVHKLLPALRSAEQAYRKRVPTGELNRVLRAIQRAHPAPGARIRYGVQATAEPPTFTLFCNRRLPAPYLRYVERRLREELEIGPTPITFRIRVGSRG
jgi:GTP-binding protein